MRLAVLDTNVLVSAGIKAESNSARILEDWVLTGQVQLVVCPWVVREYLDVFQREKFRRYAFPPGWLGFLLKEAWQLSDPAPWSRPGPDPKDLPFLALAHAAGAWLVTGNLRHFPETMRAGTIMIAPADDLAVLESGPPQRL